MKWDFGNICELIILCLIIVGLSLSMYKFDLEIAFLTVMAGILVIYWQNINHQKELIK